MRKIEQRMVEAIKGGKSFSLANTRVTAIAKEAHTNRCVSGYQSAVYLHGNLIAVFYWTLKKKKRLLSRSHYLLNSVECTLAGWPTVTTRSRLNAICQGLGMVSRFGQRKHRQMFDDRIIDENTWVTL